MTLMPVSKTSTLTDWSTNFGARAVDRQVLLGVDRAALVDGLADDVQDAAEHFVADRHHDRRVGVDDASMPRTRPSVESMAMVRTVCSPRCCATSTVRSRAESFWSTLGFLILSAV